jgi:hypothetical protein
MARSLVFSICCLLSAMAAPACASLMPCISIVNVGNVTIESTWDANWGTLDGYSVDRVDIYLTGITGAEAGNTIQAISGLWQTDTQFYVYNKAVTNVNFKSHTTIDPDTGSLYYNNYSCINFGTYSGTFTRQSGTNATYWSNIISGTWNNGSNTLQNLTPAAIDAGVDNDLDNGVPENLICSMLVKSGTTSITFGDGTSGSQFGFSSGNVVAEQFSVTQIPEPATLTLLGCGLIGLLAYAWRKRK